MKNSIRLRRKSRKYHAEADLALQHDRLWDATVLRNQARNYALRAEYAEVAEADYALESCQYLTPAGFFDEDIPDLVSVRMRGRF